MACPIDKWIVRFLNRIALEEGNKGPQQTSNCAQCHCTPKSPSPASLLLEESQEEEANGQFRKHEGEIRNDFDDEEVLERLGSIIKF